MNRFANAHTDSRPQDDDRMPQDDGGGGYGRQQDHATGDGRQLDRAAGNGKNQDHAAGNGRQQVRAAGDGRQQRRAAGDGRQQNDVAGRWQKLDENVFQPVVHEFTGLSGVQVDTTGFTDSDYLSLFLSDELMEMLAR